MFKKSLALNPNHATTHFWYGGLLAALGRFEEAIEEAQKAQRLEPLTISHLKNEAWWRYYARQYDKVIELCRGTLQLDPSYSLGGHWLSRAYRQKKEYEEAIAAIQQALEHSSADDHYLMSSLGEVYADIGQEGKALELAHQLEAMSSQSYVPEHLIALIYCALGDYDQSFKWLEKANEARDPSVIWLNVEPAFETLRDDPRFEKLLRKQNLPEEAIERHLALNE